MFVGNGRWEQRFHFGWRNIVDENTVLVADCVQRFRQAQRFGSMRFLNRFFQIKCRVVRDYEVYFASDMFPAQ